MYRSYTNFFSKFWSYDYFPTNFQRFSTIQNQKITKVTILSLALTDSLPHMSSLTSGFDRGRDGADRR